MVWWFSVASAQQPAPDVVPAPAGSATAAPAATSQAGGLSTSFNDDFELRYWTSDARLPDPADVPVFDYVEQVNRLNANGIAGKWSFALQVDEVSLWMDRYWLDDVLYVENDLTPGDLPTIVPGRFADTAYVNLEKVRATFEDDWGVVTLGDSYVAFGRGAALNLARNVDIDIDTSVQGAKVLLRPGSWDISLVAGQANRQQVWQDNPNKDGIPPDLRHLVTGVRVERFGLGPANVGAHLVGYDFVGEPGIVGGAREYAPFDAVVAGATAELLGIGGIDTFVEGDLYQYAPEQPSVLEDPPDLGYALYGSASAYPGPFVVLFEGKRYFQTERVNAALGDEKYEVAIAPTLEYERVITEDSAATLNSDDVYGGRIQVDWAAVPGKLVPYVALAVFRDLDIDSVLHFNRSPETVTHPLVGVEWIDGDYALLLNSGVRTDDRDGRFGADRQVHADVSTNFPLPGELVGYVSAAAERYHWGKNLFQQTDYFEAETSYSLSWRTWLTGTLFADYSTNPLIDSTGNISDPVYMGAELQVRPASSWTLKAFYGAQKAGIRCSGGQCRQMPGFEGARFSAVGTF